MSQTLYVMIEDIKDINNEHRVRAIIFDINEETGSASVSGFYEYLPEISDTNDIIDHLNDIYPSPDYTLKPWCYSDHPGAVAVTEHRSHFTIESDILTLAELCNIVRLNQRLDEEKTKREQEEELKKEEKRLSVRQTIEILSKLTETQKDMFVCFEQETSNYRGWFLKHVFVSEIVPEYSKERQMEIVLIKGDVNDSGRNN